MVAGGHARLDDDIGRMRRRLKSLVVTIGFPGAVWCRWLEGWGAGEAISWHDVDAIRGMERYAQTEAEVEERRHENQRGREFRALAKKATAENAKGAYRFAKLPEEWKPQPVLKDRIRKLDSGGRGL